MEGSTMNRAIMNINQASLDTIHAYSLELLHDTGIRFPSEKALAIFKKHGFRVDGSMVYFEEKDIQIYRKHSKLCPQPLQSKPATPLETSGSERPTT
jgi:trimethylamine:corrinoid methyltransferase-like protein